MKSINYKLITLFCHAMKSSSTLSSSNHVQTEVTLSYNKLQADQKQGKTLDIVLKKVKHRMVENMSSSTADALGLSRAILCNGELSVPVCITHEEFHEVFYSTLSFHQPLKLMTIYNIVGRINTCKCRRQ